MPRIILTFATAAIALAPMWALAGEREDKATAEQIAVVLRDSGQMQNYSVGVKYKNGTVWLSGRVANNQQMQAALAVISDIEGIEKIVNNLEVPKGAAAKSGMARRVSVTSAEVDGASSASRQGRRHSRRVPQAGRQACGTSRGPGAGLCRRRGRATAGVRSAAHAQLCVAQLCRVSQLCRRQLSQAVFADGLAVYRSVLSLSASAARMAQGGLGMG